MGRLGVFFCLVCVSSAVAQVLDPRGARPVEHGTRADKCATQREWPFCTSDEWGPKCPSGCRIRGLMDKYDHDVQKGLEKIRKLLDQNSNKHRSADTVSKQTYDDIREKLVSYSGSNNNYQDLAQNLRQRITDMKIKIDRQMELLGALKDQVNNQVQEIQRMEVDIDIKLRSCKGSCSKYSEHQVDQDSYVTLDKQLQQLDTTQQLEAVGSLSVMKSRPLKDVIVDSHFKSKDVDGTKTSSAQHKVNDVFDDIKTVSLVLEEEGSSSSPATVSKVPGTSFSSSSKSITELGAGGGGDPFGAGGVDPLFPPGGSSHVETSSCTRSVKRTVVHTASGPVEKLEEVMEGGPHCTIISDTSKGGVGSLFPTLTHASKSSTKGSLLGDTKTGFADPFGGDLFGGDLGGFDIDAIEDDVPNFKARSVMSARVERHADYVGQVCLRFNKPDGADRPSTPVCWDQKPRPLCSDHDWGSRCDPGCGLQTLMSGSQTLINVKLKSICEKMTSTSERTRTTETEKTMIHHHHTRVLDTANESGRSFVSVANVLSSNLTALTLRCVDAQRRLDQISADVMKLLDDVYQTEVGVDMKIRACGGSCGSVTSFTVDHSEHGTLRTQVDHAHRTRSRPPAGGGAGGGAGGVPCVTLRPVDTEKNQEVTQEAIQEVIQLRLKDSDCELIKP